MSRLVLDVHIGEVKIARRQEVLKAILGSCVGIGMIWREKSIGGLAHCLLPLRPSPTFEIGGRYVDQAFSSLLALLKVPPESYGELDLIIVGGGNMTSPGEKDSSKLVGANNFRVALEQAKKVGLKITYSEGGGEVGRKIVLDAMNGTFKVDKIPRLGQIA